MKIDLLTLLVLAVPSLAQNTVKEALAKHWKTSAEFTIAVGNAMPADSYNFRPNAAEMGFGQLMAHIAGINELPAPLPAGCRAQSCRRRSSNGARIPKRWRSRKRRLFRS